ncbi:MULTISPECIES: PACE efflux transporter [unclassified Roseivivax]|uniref:PACE efflux transporter n=1 Tax=Roseivivax sp. GX 12232 TaxID=2900547 RepID=UPI001E4AB8F5|nr:PACE efflux transporter [Roseivivax sp. GX 12232]MCE0506643.1 PACE efflux transporter [Roseivivax sp. GX 12232]
MRTTADRIRQAVSFEIIGLAIVTPLFALIFDHSLAETGVLALLGATAATAWNYLFNLGFDHALKRWRGDLHKTLPLRILHAALFEATLLVLLLPIFAWWLAISLWQALLLDLSFAVFYMGYAFVFTWGYDTLFPPQGKEGLA